MGDLISREITIETLKSKRKGFEDCVSKEEVQLNKEWNKAIEKCISEIQLLPIAYNVEKVIEQIAELRAYCDNTDCKECKYKDTCFDAEMEKIIKAGGVNG